MHDKDILTVTSKTAPTIEVDSTTNSVYIRFSKSKVATTREIEASPLYSTIDFSARGNVVGVEVIGWENFSIKQAIKKIGVSTPNLDLSDARIEPVNCN